MLSKFFRSWKLALAGSVLAYIAQLFPFPFGIFMMMMLGALWTGILLNLSMALLVKDCLAGEEPKSLLIFPALFFGWGLLACLSSWVDVATLSRKVAEMDVRTTIPFDPAKQVIVASEEASSMNSMSRTLQAEYKLDLAYTATKNESTGYFANRVLPKSLCPKSNYVPAAHINRTGFHIDGQFVGNACMVQIPERPNLSQIFLSTKTQRDSAGAEEVEYTQTSLVSGTKRAIVTTARTKVLPPIPILVAGCGLNDSSSSWQCFFSPLTFSVQVGGNGGRYESASAAILAELLGLQPRQRTRRNGVLEIDFAPDPQQQVALERAASLPEAQANAFFAALPTMLKNPPKQYNPDTHYFLTAYPERNTANAVTLLDGLKDTLKEPRKNDLRRILAQAVAAMSPDGFVANKARILEIVSDPRAYEGEPGLLIRLGDYGADAAPLLLRELVPKKGNMDNSIAAALGICRGGTSLGSPQTSVALLNALDALQEKYMLDYMREAVFRALLRTGDRANAEKINFSDTRLTRERDEVLRTLTPASPTSECRHKRGWITQFVPS